MWGLEGDYMPAVCTDGESKGQAVCYQLAESLGKDLIKDIRIRRLGAFLCHHS